MRNDDCRPTLIDAKRRGGVVALSGFDYQLWDGLVRIPSWLTNPAFEEIIFEGMEDLEARFFAPHSPRQRLLERFQAKSGDLSRGEIRSVFQSFRAFDANYPQAARVQTLVMQRLPPGLSWLSHDPARVRNARPFYCPFPDVMSASQDQLRDRLCENFGVCLGKFVAESVEIEERNFSDRDTAVVRFARELNIYWSIGRAPHRVEAAFDALEMLARQSTGKSIGRDKCVAAIEKGIEQKLPVPAAFPLHIRSDRNESNSAALEIDARRFSGGEVEFPRPSSWEKDLIVPMKRTACWLRSRGISRVMVSGSYRLSTAMVIGWALRSAVGFELDIPTRDGPWSTDDRVGREGPAPEWNVRQPNSLYERSLVVALGVLRDPAATLLGAGGVLDGQVLRLHLPQPITSASMAQASALAVKMAVDDAIARFHPAEIRLYMAVPAAFAVVIGHRWNALPTTRLYEYRREDSQYVDTGVI